MKNKIFAVVLLTIQSTLCFAATLQEELDGIWRDYSVATYEMVELDDKATALDALLVRSADLQKRYPESPLARAWVGWINMTSAFVQTNQQVGMERMMKARTELEGAIASDPNCCGTAAYVTLALIYQVPIPGMPTADPQKYFDKALAMDPNGLSPNTRYGGYLMRKGDFDAALKHVTIALAAPVNPNRAAEDKSIRDQAKVFLDQINQRMKK